MSLYKQASLIADSLNSQKELKDIYQAMHETYETIGNAKKSLVYYKLFGMIKDTIQSQNTLAVIGKEKLKYAKLEFEKQRDARLAKEKAEHLKVQYTFTAVFGTLFFIIVIGVLIILKDREKNQKLANETQKNVALTMLKREERLKEEVSNKLYNELGTINTMTKYALSPFKKVSKKDYDEVINLIDQASKTSRDISYELFSMDLKMFGLEGAIKSLFIYLNKVHDGIQFDLETNLTSENRIDSDCELHLFRISEELMKNTLAHTKATHVYIFIMYTEKSIIYRYKDNGSGFDMKTTPKKIGLKGVENRAMAMNMKIVINSNLNTGTEVLIN